MTRKRHAGYPQFRRLHFNSRFASLFPRFGILCATVAMRQQPLAALDHGPRKTPCRASSTGPHCQKDTRTSVPRLVAKVEFQRLSAFLCEEFFQVRLVTASE